MGAALQRLTSDSNGLTDKSEEIFNLQLFKWKKPLNRNMSSNCKQYQKHWKVTHKGYVPSIFDLYNILGRYLYIYLYILYRLGTFKEQCLHIYRVISHKMKVKIYLYYFPPSICCCSYGRFHPGRRMTLKKCQKKILWWDQYFTKKLYILTVNSHFVCIN